MPWQARSIVSQREEFVLLASAPGACITLLYRRFGISRQTGRLWIRRYAAEGGAGLADHSRRPLSSPGRSAESMERLVTELRGKTGWHVDPPSDPPAVPPRSVLRSWCSSPPPTSRQTQVLCSRTNDQTHDPNEGVPGKPPPHLRKECCNAASHPNASLKRQRRANRWQRPSLAV